MNSKGLWVAGLLSIFTAIAPADAAGKVAGFQYVTFSDGEAPLEDNVIHMIPCMPKNNDCIALEESISATLKQAQSEMRIARSSLEEPVEAWSLFSQLDQKILPRLEVKEGYKKITTKQKGLYSFYCPTNNCLVYSYGVVRDRYAYWVTITPGRKRLDLGPAKSIAENKPRNF